MSNAQLDQLGLAVIEASHGAYAPSPRLRVALRHLHSDLGSDAPDPIRPPATPQETRANTSTTGTPRLLLYSNAPTLRLYLCACLSASYTLDDTADVHHHIGQPSFSRPDLVIADLVTLERTRFSLLKLREPNGPLAGVPFLLLSQDPNAQLKCSPSAMPDVVLSIPVMPDMLRSTVHAMASRSRASGM